MQTGNPPIKSKFYPEDPSENSFANNIGKLVIECKYRAFYKNSRQTAVSILFHVGIFYASGSSEQHSI